MLTIDLKKQLIDKIHSTQDNAVLEEIYRLLEIGEQENEIFILSESQKQSIDMGIENIENGRFITDEEANKQIDKWLKK